MRKKKEVIGIFTTGWATMPTSYCHRSYIAGDFQQENEGGGELSGASRVCLGTQDPPSPLPDPERA